VSDKAKYLDERDDIRNWLSGDLLRMFDRWLAAHDAAVRADQIEKDAAIAETNFSEYWVSHSVATAIREQLNEGNNDA